MEEYKIVPMTNWENVPEEEITVPGIAANPDVRAFFKIAYDDDALYVRLRAKEKDIRATYKDNHGMPCEDSCLEFFFSPDPKKDTYFNIEMNPNCAAYLGIGEDVRHLTRLDPADYGSPFEPVAERTDDGWMLTYKIPYSFIRKFFPDFAPKPGDILKANAYKCGDKTSKEHYLSWKPVKWDQASAFHNPKCFGVMRFA